MGIYTLLSIQEARLASPYLLQHALITLEPDMTGLMQGTKREVTKERGVDIIVNLVGSESVE